MVASKSGIKYLLRPIQGSKLYIVLSFAILLLYIFAILVPLATLISDRMVSLWPENASSDIEFDSHL